MPTKLLMPALVLAGTLFVHLPCTFAQEQSTVAAKQAINPEIRALIAELLLQTRISKQPVKPKPTQRSRKRT
ncbi:MAG: hypothetical protein ACR2HX_02535 [Pyrinomonadaceae bacterium]